MSVLLISVLFNPEIDQSKKPDGNVLPVKSIVILYLTI
jgi:hypothetical protein